ncbi:MAG: hypothetical protein Ct9H300mP15_29250 [Gemmatimonadota bacterium]|nr:MAG: hypothetical protein Ct9H300mP15_29250 [Gemmatimonadota bacterium]
MTSPPIREIGAAVESDNYLFKPRTAVRLTNMGGASMAELTPDPRPTGALIHYYLAQEPNEEVRIEVGETTAERLYTYFHLTQSLRRKAADRKLRSLQD